MVLDLIVCDDIRLFLKWLYIILGTIGHITMTENYIGRHFNPLEPRVFGYFLKDVGVAFESSTF